MSLPRFYEYLNPANLWRWNAEGANDEDRHFLPDSCCAQDGMGRLKAR